jgi:hypothetical protein
MDKPGWLKSCLAALCLMAALSACAAPQPPSSPADRSLPPMGPWEEGGAGSSTDWGLWMDSQGGGR